MIRSSSFGRLIDGSEARLWEISTSDGLTVRVTDLGAAVQGIVVPDKNGDVLDVALGYESAGDYERHTASFGATVGRFANRIGGASFELNGRTYRLAANCGPHHLHGGVVGFDKKLWQAESLDDGVRFSRLSPDGEEGYPGDLSVSVSFRCRGRKLTIRYEAETDKDTVLNLTNHTYFNLSGQETIDDHIVKIGAGSYTPVDADCVPTGEIRPVEGSRFDLRRFHRMGETADPKGETPSYGGGYDNNFVLDGPEAAEVFVKSSGIKMTVTTDQPGLQLYTADHLPQRRGKGGAIYGHRCGICFETQHYPDSVHNPDWPSCILRGGGTFVSETTYAFSLAKYP